MNTDAMQDEPSPPEDRWDYDHGPDNIRDVMDEKALDDKNASGSGWVATSNACCEMASKFPESKATNHQKTFPASQV